MPTQSTAPGNGAGPVIILSYLHSGAEFVQEYLTEGTDLAPTVGTGILPMCEMAAAAWARISNRPGNSMSQLAKSSIRALVSIQLGFILASAGGRRWCEIVNSPPSTAQAFLQIVPSARFVCVHRACMEVISGAIAAHPWGLDNPAMTQFAASYPGNSVAAIAAYWISATRRLITFEAAHPQLTLRVRYEDVVADEHGLDPVRSALDLHETRTGGLSAKIPNRNASAGAEQRVVHPQVPTTMIPERLRKQIVELHAQLKYPENLHDSEQ
jgi:protein-tyrosine sulfotransferase